MLDARVSLECSSARIKVAHMVSSNSGSRTSSQESVVIVVIRSHRDEGHNADGFADVCSRFGGCKKRSRTGEFVVSFDSPMQAFQCAVALLGERGTQKLEDHREATLAIGIGPPVDASLPTDICLAIATHLASNASPGEVCADERFWDVVPGPPPVCSGKTRVPGRFMPIAFSAVVIGTESHDRQSVSPRLEDTAQRSDTVTLTVGGRSFTISGKDVPPRLIYGRGPMSDLRIDSDWAARMHGVIEFRDGAVMLVDYSSNGSIVYEDQGNEHRVRRAEYRLLGKGIISAGAPRDRLDPQQWIHFRIEPESAANGDERLRAEQGIDDWFRALDSGVSGYVNDALARAGQFDCETLVKGLWKRLTTCDDGTLRVNCLRAITAMHARSSSEIAVMALFAEDWQPQVANHCQRVLIDRGDLSWAARPFLYGCATTSDHDPLTETDVLGQRSELWAARPRSRTYDELFDNFCQRLLRKLSSENDPELQRLACDALCLVGSDNHRRLRDAVNMGEIHPKWYVRFCSLLDISQQVTNRSWLSSTANKLVEIGQQNGAMVGDVIDVLGKLGAASDKVRKFLFRLPRIGSRLHAEQAVMAVVGIQTISKGFELNRLATFAQDTLKRDICPEGCLQILAMCGTTVCEDPADASPSEAVRKTVVDRKEVPPSKPTQNDEGQRRREQAATSDAESVLSMRSKSTASHHDPLLERASADLGTRYEITQKQRDCNPVSIFTARCKRSGDSVRIRRLDMTLESLHWWVKRELNSWRTMAAITDDDGRRPHGILKIHDIIEKPKSAYVVTDIPPTTRLFTILGDVQIRQLADLARTLELVHERGLVIGGAHFGSCLRRAAAHRIVVTRVQPANDTEQYERLRKSGLTAGNSTYMSVEEIQGQPPTAQSDWYSFGLVLYQVLSGRPAHPGDHSIAIGVQWIRGDIPQMPQAVSRCQPLLDRLLQLNSSRRPSSGAEVADELESSAF